MTKFATGVTVTSAGTGRILIRTLYNPEFTKKIKEIPGRRWDFDQRGWNIPASEESRACKIARDFFPPDDPDAWKDRAANIIASQVLAYLPEGFEVISMVVEEEDGSTTTSIRRSGAPKLEEVNIVIEDDWRLRESIQEEDAEFLAKQLQDKKSYWVGFQAKSP